MPEPFIGEIKLIPFNFAPRNWAFCNGQLMSIAQNQALFALLGTIYGGNGINTFALPNLQGRAILHQGQGPGLNPRTMGEQMGASAVTLNVNEIPPHSHALNVSGNAATVATPGGELLALAPAAAGTPNGTAPTGLMPGAIRAGGGGQPHDNRQPYLVLNYIICLFGVFPSRD